MKHSNEFEELISFCTEHDQYIGLGNPNSRILFVGKEAGEPVDSINIPGDGKSWKENAIDFAKKYVPQKETHRKGNHTWQKYQKLYRLILAELNTVETELEDKEITFVENVFTTELSNLPAPRTKEAKKLKDFDANLKNRKNLFWKNEFIKQFPIIIIAASDKKYIETYSGEVCELFDVEFFEVKAFGKSGKMWIHYSVKEKNNVYPKLVIHTRQLTNGASDNLLHEIARTVKKFIEQHNIEIKLK